MKQANLSMQRGGSYLRNPLWTALVLHALWVIGEVLEGEGAALLNLDLLTVNQLARSDFRSFGIEHDGARNAAHLCASCAHVLDRLRVIL
jgi:hypothetical protein